MARQRCLCAALGGESVAGPLLVVSARRRRWRPGRWSGCRAAPTSRCRPPRPGLSRSSAPVRTDAMAPLELEQLLHLALWHAGVVRALSSLAPDPPTLVVGSSQLPAPGREVNGYSHRKFCCCLPLRPFPPVSVVEDSEDSSCTPCGVYLWLESRAEITNVSYCKNSATIAPDRRGTRRYVICLAARPALAEVRNVRGRPDKYTVTVGSVHVLAHIEHKIFSARFRDPDMPRAQHVCLPDFHF